MCLFLGGILALLGVTNEDLVDVWDNTGRSDGDIVEKLIKFFIIANGKHDVTWRDTGLLVVAGGIAGKFENFDSEVFKNGGHENWSTGTDTFTIAAFTEESVKTTDWELKTGTGRASLWMRAFAIGGGLSSSLLNTFLSWAHS